MKRLVCILLAAALCVSLFACSSSNTDSSTYNRSTASDTQSNSNTTIDTNNNNEEEPTEEELENLFRNAMQEINALDTEDPCDYIKHIFSDVEVYSENCITINQLPYAKTSLNYSRLVEYFANTFTDESLEWVLSTKFSNVDEMVYCCTIGGKTGKNIQLISIEKLQKNTYKSTFLICYAPSDTEELSTEFETKKTDAGYRISSIGYHPASLD